MRLIPNKSLDSVLLQPLLAESRGPFKDKTVGTEIAQSRKIPAKNLKTMSSFELIHYC